jgi:hypothetical protein
MSDTNLVDIDLKLSVTGTTEYISQRITYLKNKYNAKCQGNPIKSRLSKAAASEGISEAFGRSLTVSEKSDQP